MNSNASNQDSEGQALIFASDELVSPEQIAIPNKKPISILLYLQTRVVEIYYITFFVYVFTFCPGELYFRGLRCLIIGLILSVFAFSNIVACLVMMRIAKSIQIKRQFAISSVFFASGLIILSLYFSFEIQRIWPLLICLSFMLVGIARNIHLNVSILIPITFYPKSADSMLCCGIYINNIAISVTCVFISFFLNFFSLKWFFISFTILVVLTEFATYLLIPKKKKKRPATIEDLFGNPNQTKEGSVLKVKRNVLNAKKLENKLEEPRNQEKEKGIGRKRGKEEVLEESKEGKSDKEDTSRYLKEENPFGELKESLTPSFEESKEEGNMNEEKKNMATHQDTEELQTLLGAENSDQNEKPREANKSLNDDVAILEGIWGDHLDEEKLTTLRIMLLGLLCIYGIMFSIGLISLSFTFMLSYKIYSSDVGFYLGYTAIPTIIFMGIIWLITNKLILSDLAAIVLCTFFTFIGCFLCSDIYCYWDQFICTLIGDFGLALMTAGISGGINLLSNFLVIDHKAQYRGISEKWEIFYVYLSGIMLYLGLLIGSLSFGLTSFWIKPQQLAPITVLIFLVILIVGVIYYLCTKKSRSPN